MNYYQSDATAYRSRKQVVNTGTLLELPWPSDWNSGQVMVAGNDTTVASLVWGRSGGSPAIVGMSSLSGVSVLSNDLTITTPTVGKVTLGRSDDGTKFQLYNDIGSNLTFTFVFLG